MAFTGGVNLGDEHMFLQMWNLEQKNISISAEEHVPEQTTEGTGFVMSYYDNPLDEECAVYLYGVPCIGDIVKDFDECIEKSKRVTKKSIRKEKLYYKIVGLVMKAVAPLM